jgi:hypothetical protein
LVQRKGAASLMAEREICHPGQREKSFTLGHPKTGL